MHKNTIEEFAEIAVMKIDYLKKNPIGFFISTMMAGAYVGVALGLLGSGQALDLQLLDIKEKINSSALVLDLSGCFLGAKTSHKLIGSNSCSLGPLRLTSKLTT